MAQAKEPVYFCDPDEKEGRRIVGDHYTVHVDGPDGPQTYLIDLCGKALMGTRGHDGPMTKLLDLLREHGKEVIGAELILPGDRTVIPHSREETHSVERVPTASLFPGLEPAPEDSKPEEKPPLPVPQFSAEPPPQPVKEEEEEEFPDTLYELIAEHAKERGGSIKAFAGILGVHPQTLYNVKRETVGPQRAGDLLKWMGYSGDKLHRLVLKYASTPEAVPVDPTPGLEAVIDRTISRAPRPPKAVEVGDRSGGLHTTAIYGNGQTRGSNPVLGIA